MTVIYLLKYALFPKTGDNSQLKPLKTVGNKTVITESIFDLPMSEAMHRFTIQEQHRCTTFYATFLGK